MKTSGATTSGVSSGARAWLRNHRNIAIGSLVDLLKNRITSLMTVMVLGIAMGLPLLLYVFLINVLTVTENFDGDPRISIFLNKEAAEEDIESFLKIVEKHPNTEMSNYISPEETLLDFQLHSNFADVLNSLSSNPFPAAVSYTHLTLPTNREV